MRLPGVPVGTAAAAVESFLAAPRVEVQRVTKKGLRTFDARAAVVRLAASADVGADPGDTDCAILDLVVRHAEPAVRPDDVLAGLREIAGLRTSVAPLVRRLAQGPLDLQAGTVGDPLVSDRDMSTPQG
jgi:hypothetical protein